MLPPGHHTARVATKLHYPMAVPHFSTAEEEPRRATRQRGHRTNRLAKPKSRPPGEDAAASSRRSWPHAASSRRSWRSTKGKPPSTTKPRDQVPSHLSPPKRKPTKLQQADSEAPTLPRQERRPAASAASTTAKRTKNHEELAEESNFHAQRTLVSRRRQPCARGGPA